MNPQQIGPARKSAQIISSRDLSGDDFRKTWRTIPTLRPDSPARISEGNFAVRNISDTANWEAYFPGREAQRAKAAA